MNDPAPIFANVCVIRLLATSGWGFQRHGHVLFSLPVKGRGRRSHVLHLLGPVSWVPGEHVGLRDVAATLAERSLFGHMCLASSLITCLSTPPPAPYIPFPIHPPSTQSLFYRPFTMCPYLPLKTQAGWPWMPSLTR